MYLSYGVVEIVYVHLIIEEYMLLKISNLNILKSLTQVNFQQKTTD